MKGKVIFILLLSMFITNSLAFANGTELSEAELNYLNNEVGLNDSDISNLPVEILKDLINNEARLLTRGPKLSYNLNSEGANGGIQINSLTQSDMSLTGYAFEQISDWSGYKQIHIIGSFDWNIIPVVNATDKLSIGYPDNAGFLLRTNNGLISGHQTAIQRKPRNSDSWDNVVYNYQPADWEPGLGVTGEFFLGTNYKDWKGWVIQKAYVPNSSTGTTNIKIQYGHSILGFTPTITTSPSGIGITPTMNTEVLSYALTVSY